MAKGLDSAAGGVRNDQEVAQNGPRSEGETYPCYCQMSIRSAYRVVKVQIPKKRGFFRGLLGPAAGEAFQELGSVVGASFSVHLKAPALSDQEWLLGVLFQ